MHLAGVTIIPDNLPAMKMLNHIRSKFFHFLGLS